MPLRNKTISLCAAAVAALLLPPALPAGDADAASRSPRDRGVRLIAPTAPTYTALTGSGVVTAPQPARPSITTTAAAPASIATDCSRDVSSELNGWLASLPSSGVRAVLPRGACYRTDTAITLSGKMNWVVDGSSSTLRRDRATPAALKYPANNRHFAVVGGSNIVVRDLRVSGLNVVSDVPKYAEYGTYVRELEFEHAFSAWNSNRLLFQDLRVDAVFGDGVYLHSDVKDVTLHRADIARNGRQGVGVLASRVLIDGVTLRSSRRAGFDLEPDLRPMSDVEVRNSTISSHLLAFASGGPGNVDRIHLHHNTIRKSGVPFLYAAREGHTRNDWTITDNWVQPYLGSPVAAVRLHNAQRARLERNVIPVTDSQSRLIFDLARGSDVTGDCNSFRFALQAMTLDRDGTSSVRLTRSELGQSPPACMDVQSVGAPRERVSGRTSNDWFDAATIVPPVLVGRQSQTYVVNNAAYTLEDHEQNTYGVTGRSAWFRYTTGAAPESVAVRTTGRLRSIKIITGSELYWQLPLAEHYDTGELAADLAPKTTYSIQVDDSTYNRGSDAARTLTVHRLR